MINRIPKFHEVIELFYDHGLFKWSKTSLPRKGQSLEQRQRREQAIVEILVQQLAGGADDPLLRPVLGNLRDMHRHLGLVTLFPDREVCGSHFYFWLLVWPQLELMFEDALQHEHGSIPLRYLAHCYQRHGANLFNEKVLSRRVILASLGEQLSQALSDAGINSQKAAAAQSQVLKKLGRLIRHDSFPSRTSVDEPLRELTQALARLPKKAEAISRHLLQLLEGGKILHAVGMSPLAATQRPTLPDRLLEVHRELYRQARDRTTAPIRPSARLLDRLVDEFKAQIKHVEPARFLSLRARQVGSSAATGELIRHNAGQFHAYVLLEQIKSDLSIGGRLQRVGNSVQILTNWFGGGEEDWLEFFSDMPKSMFLLNAIFSSALSLISSLAKNRALDEALGGAIRCLGEAAAQASGAQRDQLLAVAAREQISVLKKVLDTYHSQHHLGRLAVEILAFLYAFKYKYDPGFQPHATDKLEAILDDCIDKRDIRHRIVYETPFEACGRTLSPSGTDAALIMIHHYNRYVLTYSGAPTEYLCNPLQRLSEVLQHALTSAMSDRGVEDENLKRCINAEFGTGKSKSIMRIGGIRPYECLRDIGFYLSALHLETQEALNPGLFLYLALPHASQRLILRLLSPVSYAEDLKRQPKPASAPTGAVE